jgi:hypothetical protein
MQENKQMFDNVTEKIDITADMDNIAESIEQDTPESTSYFIISENKHALSSDRKINKVRLNIERFMLCDRPYMKYSVDVLNQSNTSVIKTYNAGKNTVMFLNNINDKNILKVLTVIKRKCNKFMTNKERKSVDSYLSKYAVTV